MLLLLPLLLLLLLSVCPAALWFKEGVLAWDQTMTPWLQE
jgi:hypothetical protein